MRSRPDPVVIREVGLRDGLQSIARVLPTAQKLEWIRDTYAAGQREIEVGISTAFGCTIQGRVASGNVTTEDLVYLFASMNVATGQDFDRLIALPGKLAAWLDGEMLHGTLWRAGLPLTMRDGAHATPR